LLWPLWRQSETDHCRFERLLRRPAAWKPVVAVNVVALTIFLWPMTAYLVVLWGYEGLGRTLPAQPIAGWWAQRWLWLLAPSAVLAVLVVLSPVRTTWLSSGSRRPADRAAQRGHHRFVASRPSDSAVRSTWSRVVTTTSAPAADRRSAS
jgi:hypothetical protein